MVLKEKIIHIFKVVVDITKIGEISLQNIITFSAMIVSVFIIEYIFVGWEKSAVRKVIKFDKTTRNDLIYWILEILNLYNFIAFVLSIGICYYLAGILQGSMHLNLVHYLHNPYLQFIIVFVLADFKNYFKHYLFHKIKPLWAIHAVHHSSTSFNIITRYRSHFLEMSISRLFDVLPFIILGIPIQTFFAVIILKEVHQLLLHSSINSNWSFIGKYILVSPAAHRIHHSIKKEHYNKNLGSTFIFWDKIFGTHYEPETVTEIGIPNNVYNKKSFVFDVFITVKNSGTEIKKIFLKKLKSP